MYTIYTGGEVVTLDPENPRANAVAVRDGTIVGVGELDAVRREHASAVEVDLEGGCLVPGLVDHHLHLTAIGLALLNEREDERLFLQLAGADSASAVVERVRERAALVPPGEWILGMGWNQHDWGTPALPDRRELSSAVPEHPVFLVRIDAHSAWVNDAALAAAGIDDDTPDPEGGKIERAADGSVRGMLIERAVEPVLAQIPVAAGWELREAFKLATHALAAAGVTTAFDAGFMASPAIVSMGVDFEVLLDLLTWADAETPFPIDVNLMIPSPSALADKVVADPAAFRELSPRVRVTHVKLYADGAFGSRGAALSHAYADDAGTRGFMRMTDAQIEFETRRAICAGLDIATHAIGDEAVHRVLQAYARVADELGDVDPRRFRIEHFGYSSFEDQQLAAERDFLLVAQPNFIDPDDDGRAMEDWRLGSDACARVYPWRTMEKAGANLAISSDYYVAPGPPLLDFHAACTRANRRGRPAAGWQPQERLSRRNALRLSTTLHAGGGVRLGGALRPGAPADLAVLSADPLSVPEDQILEIEVLKTLRRGEVTHSV